MNTLSAIERIEQDFKQGEPPFDNVTFPEERLLDELPHNSMEDRARLVTIFSTLDYNRDANQLVDKLLELHKGWPHLFEPQKVHSKKKVEHAFEKVSFRYGNRDANGWYKNCQILNEKYSGRVTELLLSVGADALNLVQRLEDDGFKYLKGVKIAPMYARIINDEVVTLDKLWELNIPVDLHIRRLSKELFDDDSLTDDEIREHWYMYGVTNNVDRHIVDGAMWQVGNNWDDWGKDYWEEVIDDASVEE